MGLFGNDSTTTSQTNAPWKPAQPYIQRGMARAQQLQQLGKGFKAPNFQTYAPMSARTQNSLGQMQGIAQQGNPLAGQSMGAISGILGGQMNDKYNQLYDNADNAHFETATNNQAGHIADDVARYYGDSGRFGSDVSNAGMAKAIGDFREQALSNQWNQNIANQRGILGDQSQGQLAAVAAAPGAYQQQYLPAERLGQVGAAYDDLRARQLQSRVDKFNTRQQAPWNRLNAYTGAISGNTQGTGQSTSTVQQPNNWLGQVLGGGLGLASLFSGL